MPHGIAAISKVPLEAGLTRNDSQPKDTHRAKYGKVWQRLKVALEIS